MNRQSAVGNRNWTLLAVVLAAVSVFLLWLTPPAPQRVDVTGWDALARRTVPGAFHVHTSRSDGHGDRDAVAAAAERAGLAFVILTDHGDATRPPDPPEYRHNVLLLDAVEISTDDGHYVALDMPRAPYPLGGAGDAVVEDVHRLGGFGIAAHPDSPKAALGWRADSAPFDALEWINADSEWRDDSRRALLRAGLAYVLRPAPALATLLDRPSTLDRWDALLRARRVFALGASDAHGGPGQRVEDQGRSFFGTIGIPSYEASFRELSLRCVLEAPLRGSAGEDAHAVFAAIRAGRVFTSIDALASPALLDFHAAPSGATVTLHARATLPRGGELVLIGPDGETKRTVGELTWEVNADRPAAYRIEGRLPSAPGEPPVPWLVSNPIYVGDLGPERPEQPPPVLALGGQFPWRIEKDAASSAILRNSDHAAELEYRLGDGLRSNQFVALASDLQAQTFTAADFVLASDRPARLAIQVRTRDGRRWGRSFYVDPAGTSIHARLTSLKPIDRSFGPVPSSEALTSVLLVIDLTNAFPAQHGQITVRSSDLVK